MTVTVGTAELNDNVVAEGDVAWDVRPALAPGASPGVFASCFGQPADVSFSTTFYDMPAAPTSFAGVGSASGSVLGFVAGGTAKYVADVTLSGGAVTLWSLDGAGDQHFAASGRLALGTLQAGDRALLLTADDGPRPAWTVAIRALPVAVSQLAFEHPVARPGTALRATYATDGDTTVSAVIANRAGRVVAEPMSDVAVGPGVHDVMWDGRATNGRPLRTGLYTLHLATRDPSGERATATASVTLDGQAPAIRVTSRPYLRPDEAVTGTFAEALSGIASATIADEANHDRVDLPGGATTFSYRPSGGWEPGRHRLLVTSTDGAGNTRSREAAFTVCGSAPDRVRSPSRRGEALREDRECRRERADTLDPEPRRDHAGAYGRHAGDD